MTRRAGTSKYDCDRCNGTGVEPMTGNGVCSDCGGDGRETPSQQADREARWAEMEKEWIRDADDEDLEHEKRNIGELQEIAEDDGDAERARNLQASYDAFVAEQERRTQMKPEKRWDGRLETIDDPELTHDQIGLPLDDRARRFYRHRMSGYDGWLDQDANPVDATEQARLNKSFGHRPKDRAPVPTTPDRPPLAASAAMAVGGAAVGAPIGAMTSAVTAGTGSTTTPGGSMSDIGNAKGNIGKANDLAEEAVQFFQQGVEKLEEAQQALQQAAEDSERSEFSDAIGGFQNAIQEGQEAVQAAQQAAEQAEAGQGQL